VYLWRKFSPDVELLSMIVKGASVGFRQVMSPSVVVITGLDASDKGVHPLSRDAGVLALHSGALNHAQSYTISRRGFDRHSVRHLVGERRPRLRFLGYGHASNPGTFTGEIDGLTDNTMSSATAVYIDTSTIGFPFTLPYNTLTDDVNINSFTVVNEAITAFDLSVQGIFVQGINNYIMDLSSVGGNGLSLLNSGTLILNEDGAAGVKFTAITVTTPEPTSLALLATGLAALVALWPLHSRRRKISPV